MRIAVAGGSGLVGGHVLKSLRQAGHETVTIARSDGVDVTTGRGLDGALAGVDAAIDVSNTTATDRARSFSFSPRQANISLLPNGGWPSAITSYCQSSGLRPLKETLTTQASENKNRSSVPDRYR
jgi:hypothetical protein